MNKKDLKEILKDLEESDLVKIKGDKVYRTKFGQQVYDYLTKKHGNRK